MCITRVISNKKVQLLVTNSKYKPFTVCPFTNCFYDMHVKNGDSRPNSKNIQLFLIERKMK